MKGVRCIWALLLALTLSFGVNGQPVRNSIRLDVMLDSLGTRKLSTVRYFDGLGRPEQEVAVGVSPSGADIVRHSSRDRAGRIIRQFNAVPSAANGAFVPEADVLSLARSVYADASPYTLTAYEQSPLGRALSVTGAGQSWHSAGKAVRKTYLANSSSERQLKCRLLAVTDTRLITDTAVTVTPRGYYETGTLFVEKTVDEDGHTSLVFTNRQGRVVLARSLIGDDCADTYYVYDIAGHLTAVLPPALSATLTTAPLLSSSAKADGLGYFYIYDWLGHCRSRKLPGAAWQITGLDGGGKAVFSQDGNLRRQGKALFRLTDAFGRECVTGLVPKALSLTDAEVDKPVIAQRADSAVTLGGYEVKDNVVSLPNNDLLTVNYYDSYDWLDGKTFGTELAYRALSGYDRRFVSARYPALSTRGMLTGSAVRVLGDTVMLHRAVYYDNHGNVVQTHAQNALGGYDRHYWRLTFTGRPLSVRHEHTTADTSIVSVYSYAYDHAERLLSVSLSLNDAEPFTLFSNYYNELGQLQQQAFGAESAASVEYAYNVRGWTQNINTQCFCQTLYYETASNGVAPCYNGNISAAEWADDEGGNPQQYAFSYDGLNRLVGAEYSGGSPADSDYSCQYTYDANGNMTWLRRKGKSDVLTNFGQFGQQTVYFGDIDELTLDYSGNRLRSVSDAADALTYAGAMDFRDGADSDTEYTYDANGNMTSDANKGITAITYNVLNLPEAVTFADGHQTRYTYAADGRKLRTEYCLVSTGIIGGGADRFEGTDPFEGSIFNPFALTRPSIYTVGTSRPPSIGCLTLTARSYCGPHVYLNGRHERMLTDCGYIQDAQPHYYIKDYQGNVRAVLNSAGTVVETSSYYPYGALMATTATESAQPYKYGTKELDRENGLNLYDSQARHYDPVLGRTTTLDPRATSYYATSPYAWCANNPVKYIDPDGRQSYCVFNKKSGILVIIPDISKLDKNKPYKFVDAFSYSKLTKKDYLNYNYGIIVSGVFTGGQISQNGKVTQTKPEHKPISIGKYDILENKGNTNPQHNTFFVLDPVDSTPYNKVDDRPGEVNSEGEQRSGYNLHPGVESWGCVTIGISNLSPYKERMEEWSIICNSIKSTKIIPVPDNRGLHRFFPGKQIKYGTLKVINR